jgi:hypothetical protein
MFSTLLWATAALCAGAMLLAWIRFRDPFHPLIITAPMFAFIYAYMPIRLYESKDLLLFITEDQGVFVQTVVLLSLGAFIIGCFAGSSRNGPPATDQNIHYSREIIHKGAYWIGGAGLLCWLITIRGAGGFSAAFGHQYGMGWSEFGFIREGIYLLIVALLLLLSPTGFTPNSRKWKMWVAALAMPWVVQGLLGARRGPTIVIVMTLVMGWYMARAKLPPLTLVLGGGAALGFLVLFLVTNRENIHLNADFNQLSASRVDDFFKPDEANEYIFGAGCILTSHQTGYYFWGKRYLAQVTVRPIPRQLWPNKYADFGVPELEQNAGVAGPGLANVMGWTEVPGAAAAAVADLWVELSWLSIPLMGLIGWGYGYVWRRALWQREWWTTLYMIFALLSIYFITQSGEAVIFRFLLLAVPSAWVWKKAAKTSAASDPGQALASHSYPWAGTTR